MPDEAGLAAGCEEARSHRVIIGVGREDEGGLGVVQLARNGEHLRLRERVGVEHDPGRIAREGLAGERIDLMDLDLPRHLLIRRFGPDRAILAPGLDHSRSPCAARVQY